MQVIGLALAMGVLAFGTIVFLLPKKPPEGPYTLSIAAVIAGFAAFAVSLAAGKLVGDQSVAARERVDSEAFSVDGRAGEMGPISFLAGVYQTSFIVRCAILEGVAFFNLVVYLREAQWYTFAMATALLAAIVLSLPSQAGLESWVEQRLQRGQAAR